MTHTPAAVRSRRPGNKHIITTFDQSTATCHIFTFKEGLLSLVAHDLKLQVLKFKISVEGNPSTLPVWKGVRATFDPASITTVCAMHDGQEKQNRLNKQDCLDIERNMANDVLRTKEHPRIDFCSKVVSGSHDNFVVKGHLTICGTTRAISVPVEREDNAHVVKVTMDQRDFGIRPFTALMGTMKIKPDILIRIELPVISVSPRPKPSHLGAAKSR